MTIDCCKKARFVYCAILFTPQGFVAGVLPLSKAFISKEINLGSSQRDPWELKKIDVDLKDRHYFLIHKSLDGLQ